MKRIPINLTIIVSVLLVIAAIPALVWGYGGSAEPEAPTPEPQRELRSYCVYSIYPVDLGLEFQQYVIDICDNYQIDPALVFAIIEVESGCNGGSVGDSGNSFGLMQINQRYHQERMTRLNVSDLAEPFSNVHVGVDYLAELSASGKPTEWVLMAYNGGPAYADKLAEDGRISAYTERVMLLANEYRAEAVTCLVEQ